MNKVNWIFIENILTLISFVLVAIFAPGIWKILSLALLLNINFINNNESN